MRVLRRWYRLESSRRIGLRTLSRERDFCSARALTKVNLKINYDEKRFDALA